MLERFFGGDVRSAAVVNDALYVVGGWGARAKIPFPRNGLPKQEELGQLLRPGDFLERITLEDVEGPTPFYDKGNLKICFHFQSGAEVALRREYDPDKDDFVASLEVS